MSKTKSSRLMALSAAAAALPGVAPVANAAAPTEHNVGIRYSQYRESDIKDSDIARDADGNPRGLGERYSIDVTQLSYSGPLGDHLSLALNFQDETLSGATPWSTEIVDDEVKVIMSGASQCPAGNDDCLIGIDEHRTDGSAGLTYHYNGGSISGVAAFSTEDDYESTSFGLSWEGEFDNKQTVVGTGFSISNDEIDPEDNVVKKNARNAVQPGDVAKKDSESIFLSVSRIAGANTLIQGGMSYTKKEGYLNDAYKLNDQRPDSKEMLTVNAAIRHYVKSIKSALHADFRYYDDDWGVESYTYTFSLYKNIDKLMVVPSFRYYLQSAAKFYWPEARTQFNYFSDDARLSHYGAYSLGLKFVLDYKPVTWTLSGEYYNADQDLVPSKSDYLEHPGLIQFTRFTLGANYTF